jgi:hypothetical protein
MTPRRDSILSIDRRNGGVDVEAAELFRYRRSTEWLSEAGDPLERWNGFPL